jgi:predicted DNA-binding ribbon-helix-helix protein
MAPERWRIHGCFMEQATREEISSSKKRSIEIHGRQTSVKIEDAFWAALQRIAAARNVRPSDLVAAINKERHHNNLSSAIRVFVLEHYRSKVEGGHRQWSTSAAAPETVTTLSSARG